MDDFQFLKEEISSNKFNKRIFYAKNALRYIEIMPITFFVDNYIPYITNYILNEENVEEVLTEYSNTFIFFLKFLGKNQNFDNYKTIKDKEGKNDDYKITYNNAIKLLLKCFYEKILLNEDEILKETTINNLRDILLELDEFLLLKNEFENILNELKILNKENVETIDFNEVNEMSSLLFSLLYPFIKSDENKIDIFCNQFKLSTSSNANKKKKRLIIQNIINIIPFIKKSIDKYNNPPVTNDENYINAIKLNIHLLKEIISDLSIILDEQNLIISVGMNYLCDIILVYTIQNITEFILLYDEYNKFLTNQEIDLIIINYLTKLENFINNETILKVNLTWRVKVAYIENICRLKNLVNKHNPQYFNEYYSNYCENILKGNNIEPDLKISILKNIDVLVPTINKFIPIINETLKTEKNQYILSSLGIAINNIMNSKILYEINNNENAIAIVNRLFQFINILLNNNIFEIKYHLLSSFDFSFFNHINKDAEKILYLNEAIKLYIYSFQRINEWRIRYNLFEKFKNFILEKNNFLKLFSFYQIFNNNSENAKTIFELINNIRNLIHLFFLEKANIIRINSLELINCIINFQKDNNINNEICLIRIKEELINYQISIFCKNSTNIESIINNLNLLDMNKNYCMKLFFIESVKKFINLYSLTEKNLIKNILQLIKNGTKYAKENIANNKINNDIEVIIGNLKDVTN